MALAVLMAIGASGRAEPSEGGEWAVKAERLERHLLEAPADEDSWAALVHACLEQGDSERAEKTIARWQTSAGKPSAALDRARGEVAFAQKKWANAITALQQYLKAAPKDHAAWTQLAVAHENIRSWERASEAVSKAIALQPTPERLAQRARYRLRLHAWDEAEADVREANRLDPTSDGAKALLPLFERVAQWKGPISRLDARIAADPENGQLRLDRAEWLVGIGLRDAATEDVEVAFKAEPTSLRARLWRGLLAWDRGAAASDPETMKNVGDVREMALSEIDSRFERELRELESSNDAEARAAFLLVHEQPVLALSEVQKIDGSPSRTLALLQLQRWVEAGVAARRAVEANPKSHLAWYGLARVEIENGNIREAVDALRRSLRLQKTPEAAALLKETERRLTRR